MASGCGTNAESYFERVQDLSTLPAMLKRIMEITVDPELSIARMEEAISTNPVISTRLLRIVNSAYYSFFRGITSIRQTIVVLGLEATRNLVYSTSIITAFGRDSEIERFPLEAFWQYSVACGNVSRTLASMLDHGSYQEAFLAGLVHDIGKIVFATYSPELFERALIEAEEESIPLRTAEKMVYGFDHHELGQLLANRWRLPKLLEEVITHSESPADAEHFPELSAVVGLAEQLCRAYGIGNSGEPEVEIDPLLSETWLYLCERNPILQTMDINRFTASLEEEVERVESFVKAIFEE